MYSLLVGAFAVAVTVSLHAFSTSIIVSLLKKYAVGLHERFHRRSRPLIVGVTSVCLLLKHYIDIVFWATVYWTLVGAGQFDGFENALYFSSVTYTSLGYGDFVLTGPWRLLCGIEAINGILLFGWSTALLFILVQRLWQEDIHYDETDHDETDYDETDYAVNPEK